jgi:hypothetical protein
MCPKLCIGLDFAQNMLHKRHTQYIQLFIACFQDLSTRRRPFSTGMAVKNAVKEPTERDSMPVAGPRRTGMTGTVCSPMHMCRSRLYAITWASGSTQECGCSGNRRTDKDCARLMEQKRKGESEQYERWREIIVAVIAREGAHTQHASGPCATSVPIDTSTPPCSVIPPPEGGQLRSIVVALATRTGATMSRVNNTLKVATIEEWGKVR